MRSTISKASFQGVAALAVLGLAASLALTQPAFAQFGLNIGGLSLGGLGGGRGGGWGNRGGYGGGGYGGAMRPNRPMQQPGGGYGGGTRPRPYPGQMPGGVYGGGAGSRPYPGQTSGGMQRPYPYPGGHRPYPGGTRPHHPHGPVIGHYPSRPWVVTPGRPYGQPAYRPPRVVVTPPLPSHRPGRPIVVERPQPLRLKPFRPMVAQPPVRRPPPVRAAPAAPPPAVAAADRTFVDREILVEVAGAQPPGTIGRIAAQNGLTLLGSAELTLAGTTVHRLRVNGRRSVDQVVGALGRDGRVALAQRNHVYRLLVDAGQAYYPLAPHQYAAARLRLADAHRMATGEGIAVAVIDSGVDTGHPELRGAIGASENTLSSAASPDGHGTAIAGAIGARGQLMGVAPGTRILAIRAFAPATARAKAEGTSWDIVRAVDLAAKAGARVVNMSFAGPADRLMSREIAGGVARSIVFVAAAGNAGAAAPPAYPAAEPGVIAVTATDAQDRLYDSANRGPYVTVAAPGVDVLVASPNAGYDTSTGTSVAAAHVSGIVALMLQRHATMTPGAIRAALVARARDLGPTGPDPEYGAGLVDAFSALGGMDAPSMPPPPPAASTPVAQGSPPPPPIAVTAAEPASAPITPAAGPPAPSMAPAAHGSPPPAPPLSPVEPPASIAGAAQRSAHPSSPSAELPASGSQVAVVQGTPPPPPPPPSSEAEAPSSLPAGVGDPPTELAKP